MFTAFVLIVTVGFAAVYFSDAESESLWQYLVSPAVAFVSALALFYWFLLFVLKARFHRTASRREHLESHLEKDDD